MNILLVGVTTILIANSMLCLYRASRGPTMPDRILAINAVGSVAISVLILISYVLDSGLYLDVAMVYAILNFTGTVAVSRYLEIEGWSEKSNDDTDNR
jgi:multicomponent Na+:H+ antiporter subunit F